MWRSTLHDAAPAGYRVPPRPVEAFPYPLPLSRESVAITSTFSREATIPRSSTFLREATGTHAMYDTGMRRGHRHSESGPDPDSPERPARLKRAKRSRGQDMQTSAKPYNEAIKAGGSLERA